MAGGLLEALKAFSSPRWWEVGTTLGPEERRKRGKAAEFQKACAERHEEMRKVYESAMAQDSEQRWLRKVSADGTSADKVASLTMLIQLCPIFSTAFIKALLTMAGKSARSDSTMAMDALKELFLDNLLPGRKLKRLEQMEPVSAKGLKKSTFTEICVVSFFEDYLKTAYAAFVQIVAAASHNTVAYIKSRAVRTAYDLLKAKPEQEKALLALLINKLGDSSPKVTSNVSYCVRELLKKHPGMKSPVLKEVEALIARPNITQKSKYAALLMLSEFVFGPSDGACAASVVRLFVQQLELALRKPRLSKKEFQRKKRGLAVVKKKRGPLREEDNRLVRTLINGIRRAMPYMNSLGGSPLSSETVDALFKVCHTVAAFSTRVSILALLQRGLSSGDPPDRFYRLLYEQLGFYELFASANARQALLLLQKCIPSDASCTRATAMARRILQLGLGSEPKVGVATLQVMRDLFVARRTEIKPMLHSVASQLTIPEEEGEVEEEHFVDDEKATAKVQAKTHYDPLVREPRFSRARNAPLWEIQALSCHVHPTVASYASKLLEAEAFQDVAGNPLDVFSVPELLEQFAYHSKVRKNDKSEKFGRSQKKAAVNSETFLKLKTVQPHERFFKAYFKDPTVQAEQTRKRKAKKREEELVDEEDGQDADAFFDEYLKGEMQDADDVDEDEDEDDDDDMDMDEDGDEDQEENAGGDSDSGDDGVFCEGDADEDEVALQSKGKKDRRETLRGLKRKQKDSSSMFASIDDYQKLLDADG